MEIYEILILVITPVIAILGFFVKKAFMKLEQTMTENEIRILLRDKLEPIQVNLVYIQRDLDRIYKAQEKILEHLEQHGKDRKIH